MPCRAPISLLPPLGIQALPNRLLDNQSHSTLTFTVGEGGMLERIEERGRPFSREQPKVFDAGKGKEGEGRRAGEGDQTG